MLVNTAHCSHFGCNLKSVNSFCSSFMKLLSRVIIIYTCMWTCVVCVCVCVCIVCEVCVKCVLVVCMFEWCDCEYVCIVVDMKHVYAAQIAFSILCV